MGDHVGIPAAVCFVFVLPLPPPKKTLLLLTPLPIMWTCGEVFLVQFEVGASTRFGRDNSFQQFLSKHNWTGPAHLLIEDKEDVLSVLLESRDQYYFVTSHQIIIEYTNGYPSTSSSVSTSSLILRNGFLYLHPHTSIHCLPQ